VRCRVCGAELRGEEAGKVFSASSSLHTHLLPVFAALSQTLSARKERGGKPERKQTTLCPTETTVIGDPEDARLSRCEICVLLVNILSAEKANVWAPLTPNHCVQMYTPYADGTEEPSESGLFRVHNGPKAYL